MLVLQRGKERVKNAAPTAPIFGGIPRTRSGRGKKKGGESLVMLSDFGFGFSRLDGSPLIASTLLYAQEKKQEKMCGLRKLLRG